MNALPPPIPNEQYTAKKHGYLGRLGQGANTEVVFLQTAITKSELDKITLIQNIPGSSKWPVRDLFQRDVDEERVADKVLPYLQDENQIKFFNPLTLVALPMEADLVNISKELKVAERESVEIEGHTYKALENPGFFRFLEHDLAAYSRLEWNPNRVHIVAIDGQHRLSALKRWKNTPGDPNAFTDWLIPVVVLGAFKVNEEADASDLLDLVRRTFVNINSRAEDVHEARKILLDDESVNAICTQEVVERSHENDCLEVEHRDDSRVPLLFFDWRGEVKNGIRIPSPGAIKTVEEVRDWFRVYIAGDDGSDNQAAALGIEDMIPRLETFSANHRLSHADAARIRHHVNQDLIPGFLNALNQFNPFTTYIDAARRIESDALEDGPDISQHAFDLIRFGTCNATPNLLKAVQVKAEEIIQDFLEERDDISDLLSRDIGMRAVICAYGLGKRYFDDALQKTSAWCDYSDWFVKGMNDIYEEGWFEGYDDLDEVGRKVMTHIVFDPSGSIINYKLEVQKRGFGALLLVLLFCKYGDHELLGGNAVNASDDVLNDFYDTLESLIKGGYTKQLRGELQDHGTPAEIRAEASKRGKDKAEAHMKQIVEFIES